MSSFKDYYNQKMAQQTNVSSSDEDRYLDALKDSANYARMPLKDFLKVNPEAIKQIPLFVSYARTQNPEETIINLVNKFQKNPRLNERKDVIEEMAVAPEIHNGDKVTDHFSPRKLGLVLNASPNNVTVKWQDGKISSTSPSNLKLAVKAVGFKNDDKVINKNGTKGVIINAQPASNMDIAANFPVVLVQWDNGKTNSANASELQIVHENHIMGPVSADAYKQLVHKQAKITNQEHAPREKFEFVSAQQALGMLSKLNRILLDQGKVVKSRDGMYEVQKAGYLYKIKKIS